MPEAKLPKLKRYSMAPVRWMNSAHSLTRIWWGDSSSQWNEGWWLWCYSREGRISEAVHGLKRAKLHMCEKHVPSPADEGHAALFGKGQSLHWTGLEGGILSDEDLRGGWVENHIQLSFKLLPFPRNALQAAGGSRCTHATNKWSLAWAFVQRFLMYLDNILIYIEAPHCFMSNCK